MDDVEDEDEEGEEEEEEEEGFLGRGRGFLGTRKRVSWDEEEDEEEVFLGFQFIGYHCFASILLGSDGRIQR